MKSGGPLLGYNNNIPYKGQVYHVQTEDSGSKRPHVITHLFADGGRIIKTRKTSYAELVGDGSQDIADQVRSLMREQHKGMVISLRDGDLDHLIDPDPDSPPDPKEIVEEMDAAPPSAPIELLERAAAVDESAFQDEIERVVKAPSAPPKAKPAGGTYSFVGDREEPPTKRGGSAPRRRMRPTGQQPLDASPESAEAPPAVDVAAPARKRPPPPRRAKSATGAGMVFGRKHGSSQRLDELMAAYLARG